jgi:Zn-dependent protease with chaperone function
MLQALPYHLKVRDHFAQQAKTWNFFAANKTKEEQLAQYKTELLKNTYKFDVTADAGIYEKVNKAKEKLGLEQLPVTVYQAQYTDEMNASIVFLNNEAHIVFSGRITQLLDENELLAILAHELTHIKLYSMLRGELETAERIIMAIAGNYHSEAAYYETARLYRLYTEIFCDRGAYTVVEDTKPVISSLVKIATGLDTISAESYSKQAEEIFSTDNGVKATTVSHPENFIRARAIQLWHEKKDAAEPEIIKMIEGMTDLDQLDVFKQKELLALSRKFLQLFLKPNWFRSSLVTGMARQFFPDFSYDDTVVADEQFTAFLGEAHSSIRDYLAYVMLDFALVDGQLEQIPFGWAFQFAENLQLKDVFDAIVKKELQLTDKKLQQHKQNTMSAWYKIKEGEKEQVYEAEFENLKVNQFENGGS